LEEALASVQARLTPQDGGFIEVASQPRPGPREYTVDRIVPKNKITSVFADGGTGKTYFSMVIATMVVMGRKFLGELHCQQGNVLYLDFEDDAEEFVRRVFEIGRGLGLDALPQGLFYRRFTKPLGEVVFEVMQAVSERDIKLVIVDSFGAACGGDAERSGDSIRTMQLLQAIPATVLLNDHEPKPMPGRVQSQFGSIYKRNLSRSQLRLEDRGFPEPGKHALILWHTKLNVGPLRGKMPLYLRFEADTVYLDKGGVDDPAFADDQGVVEQVLGVLETLGKGTAVQVAENLGRKEAYIRNVLTRLVKAKRVVHGGKEGKAIVYVLPEAKSESNVGNGG
jgi:hypothetical protein